ncbi:MAG TPA: ABC transporter substrate-binding protein [Firmicutes bacterium]|nr:ABC transporter substrate-binding protein [Bacillota bacterium]
MVNNLFLKNVPKASPRIELLLVATVTTTVLLSPLPQIRIYAATTSQQPVTISFWHCWGGEREPWMKEVIQDFQKQYPWITVEQTLLDTTGHLEKLLAQFAAGIMPDVAMITQSETVELADKGALLPLDHFIQKHGIDLNIFYKSDVTAFNWKGQQYALPMPSSGGNSGIVFYNKDLFEEAGLNAQTGPRTWQDIETAGRKLTTFYPDGRIKTIACHLAPSAVRFVTLLYNNAGMMISDDARRILYHSPEGIETLDWMVEYTEKVNRGLDRAQAFYRPYPGNDAFYKGVEAIRFSGVSFFAALSKQEPRLDYGVALYPYNSRNPNAKPAGVTGLVFGWGYGIPQKKRPSAQEEAAFLLIRWLTTSVKGAGWFPMMQGRPSAIRGLNKHEGYFAVNPHWNVVLAELEAEIAIPVTPVHSQIMKALEKALVPAFSRERSAKAVLADAAAEAQRMLDAYWAKQ